MREPAARLPAAGDMGGAGLQVGSPVCGEAEVHPMASGEAGGVGPNALDAGKASRKGYTLRLLLREMGEASGR